MNNRSYAIDKLPKIRKSKCLVPLLVDTKGQNSNAGHTDYLHDFSITVKASMEFNFQMLVYHKCTVNTRLTIT